jgi:hypothetical protein
MLVVATALQVALHRSPRPNPVVRSCAALVQQPSQPAQVLACVVKVLPTWRTGHIHAHCTEAKNGCSFNSCASSVAPSRVVGLVHRSLDRRWLASLLTCTSEWSQCNEEVWCQYWQAISSLNHKRVFARNALIALPTSRTFAVALDAYLNLCRNVIVAIRNGAEQIRQLCLSERWMTDLQASKQAHGYQFVRLRRTSHPRANALTAVCWRTYNHFIKQNSQRPPVGTTIIATMGLLCFDHLGRNVKFRPNQRVGSHQWARSIRNCQLGLQTNRTHALVLYTG